MSKKEKQKERCGEEWRKTKEEKGTVPEELEKRIKKQKNETVLLKWLRLASNMESIEEFQMRL